MNKIKDYYNSREEELSVVRAEFYSLRQKMSLAGYGSSIKSRHARLIMQSNPEMVDRMITLVVSLFTRYMILRACSTYDGFQSRTAEEDCHRALFNAGYDDEEDLIWWLQRKDFLYETSEEGDIMELHPLLRQELMRILKMEGETAVIPPTEKPQTMKASLSLLIEALNIFLKYGDIGYPTHCEHDELSVCVDPSIVSEADIRRLDELGFFIEDDGFKSFRYGSA